MKHTHPNVTVREGEKLSGEEIAHDNPPAEPTALPNTSQPSGISSVQLESLTNTIGQMMSLQVNSMLSAFESKLLAQIEQGELTRQIGRSYSSNETRSQTSHDGWKEEDNVLSEDSREVDEGEDNNDEGDPGSAEGSESSSSNEQRVPNSQQPSLWGNGGNDPPF